MLKYLFIAQFSDGSEYVQNEEDRSLIDPEKRSCFYDVLQRESELTHFTLFGNGHSYTVDLTDGHFIFDGAHIQLHEEEFLKDFRIIFFRDHTHTIAAGVETSHDIIYRMGWQCTVDGTNYQKVITLY